MKHRSFVFYGRSGTGKTTLSSTFPKPILLLDVRDQGTDSIEDLIGEGLDPMDIHCWDDFEMAYWFLKKHPNKYQTVIIDTTSQLQQVVIEKVLEDKSKDVEKAGDWGAMTRRDWGDVAAIMKIWILRFRDLPMNVVFVAQDRVFNLSDEDGDPEHMLDPEIGPRLSPAIAAHLNAAVSVIGNTFIRMRIEKKEVKLKGRKKPVIREKEVPEYCLRVGPNPIYITKIRKPRDIEAPSVIVDPTYEDIMEIVKGV